jgi:hypothetical protein
MSTPEPPAQPPTPPSPQDSMIGWRDSIWLAKNKRDIKMIISLATGAASAWITQHVAGDAAAILGLAVGLASKYLLDRLDFRLTNNPE